MTTTGRVRPIGDADELTRAVEDGLFLARVVKDNEHWNRNGISEKDLALTLKMSSRCAFGFPPKNNERGFSARRFKLALKAMALSGDVRKAGSNWYRSDSPGLRGTEDAQGIRRCGRPACLVDIGKMRADALYCSDGCRNRDRRRRLKTPLLSADSRYNVPD